MSNVLESKHDIDTLHRFTSGWWLWRERQQLAVCHVPFDITTLLALAAKAFGPDSGAQVVKDVGRPVQRGLSADHER